MFLTAADVMFLGSVACMVTTLSELRLLLPNAQIFKLAAIAEKKSIQDIWRTHFAEKKLIGSIVDTRCLMDLRIV